MIYICIPLEVMHGLPIYACWQKLQASCSPIHYYTFLALAILDKVWEMETVVHLNENR